MASPQLDKLRSLLKRVEARRAQPRLHAVAPHAPAPTRPRDGGGPVAAPPAMPPAARPAAHKSPFDETLSDFGSGPIDVRALAEPITTPSPELRPSLPRPSLPTDTQPLVTYRPEADTIQPARPAAATPAPFARAPAPLAPMVPSPERARPEESFETDRPAPVAELTAPTQTLEPTPLVSAASPARAVSAVLVEAPKSFGELLELSLALRPR